GALVRSVRDDSELFPPGPGADRASAGGTEPGDGSAGRDQEPTLSQRPATDRPLPLPQRPAARELYRRRPNDLDHRLGARRPRRPLFRPGKLRRQLPAGRSRGGGPVGSVLRPSTARERPEAPSADAPRL